MQKNWQTEDKMSIFIRTMEGEMLPAYMDLNGTIFVSEQYGSINPDNIEIIEPTDIGFNVFEEPTGTIIENVPIINNDDPNQYVLHQLNELNKRVDSLTTDVRNVQAQSLAQIDILKQIQTHNENMEKFICEFTKNYSESTHTPLVEPESVPKSEPEPESKTNESFDDLSNIYIKTIADMHDFEAKLKEKAFEKRFARFLRTKFTMDGHQVGGTFFNQLIRLLTDTGFFLPFTWGTRKESINLGFKQNHQTFIDFVIHMVRLADENQTATSVEELFANLLKFKKVLHERKQFRDGRNIASNVPSVRNRKKGLKRKIDGSIVKTEEMEKTKNIENDNEKENM